MKDRVFLDTNVLVYLYSSAETEKRNVSVSLFEKYVCLTNTQALNEFSNVYLKKYKIPNDKIKGFLGSIIESCDLKLINRKIIFNAVELNAGYGYSYYDCLMLASALNSGCKVLFSEDMQHGHVVEGQLQIINPFLEI